MTKYGGKMSFDKSKFIESFKTETREHLQKLNLGLLKLEKDHKNKQLLEEMMREAHTIKGSATMMGYKRIADIAHRMEDGLEDAMNRKVTLDKDHFDVLFKALDAIAPLLEDKVTWEDKGIKRNFADNLCRDIDDVFAGKKIKKKARATVKKPETKKPEIKAETVKVEAPSVKVSDVGVTEESIRVDIDKLNNIVNVSGELLISKIRLNEIVGNLTKRFELESEIGDPTSNLVKDLRAVNENISLLTSDMQDEVMKVRMVPVAYLFNTFPRAMRDLARKKGKDIDFQIKGEDTQLDKAIIDEMKDPIMHLLRNAVDHGIESPEERKAKNKPQVGKIMLSAYQEGSQVVVEVTDDGAGININKVKERAVSKDIISKDRIDDMVDEQVYQLLFTPGFSTKEDVSETSGRGVGLDVVRDNIAKLKGMVEVRSKEDDSTSFIMRVPLTLAITESLLVAAGADIFAIPIDTVVETIRVSQENIKR